MTKLYIANTSKQHVDFCYRLPDERERARLGKVKKDEPAPLIKLEPNYRVEKIPVGSQVLIGGGRLTAEQVAIILDQHADKKLVDATKISRLQEYAGLCYRLDSPVDLEKVHIIFEQNDKHLNESAEDRREAVSAAVATRLEQRSHEIGAPLNRTEVEMVEDSRAPTFATGFEVVHNNDRPSRHGNRPGPRARRGGRPHA